MAGARRPTASAGSKRPRDLKKTSTSAADEKPLFFSLDRARFECIRQRLQVVSIVVPLAHLKSKQSIYDVVLKKVLHKPFATEAAVSTPLKRIISTDDTVTPASPSTAPAPTPAQGIDVVVHVGKMEVQADSARQVNVAGDVQLSVMTTLTVARVHHGLLVGASSPSEFTDCVTVSLPLDVSAESGSASESKKKASVADTHAEDDMPSPSQETGDAAGAGASTLCLTVRCLEDEPVVPGQSVLVVSEPGGAIRCLAVRPPRRAPGPFSLVAGGDADDPFHTPASQVRIECAIPPSEDKDGADGARKHKFAKSAGRPRPEAK